MTDKAISPLRQRMIEDMTARHFAEKAQKDCIRYVKSFAAFLGRIARCRQRRGLSSVSTAHDEDPCQPGSRQCDGRRAAVLFQGDARTGRSGPASDVGK
jgi:hypothetical protein